MFFRGKDGHGFDFGLRRLILLGEFLCRIGRRNNRFGGNGLGRFHGIHIGGRLGGFDFLGLISDGRSQGFCSARGGRSGSSRFGYNRFGGSNNRGSGSLVLSRCGFSSDSCLSSTRRVVGEAGTIRIVRGGLFIRFGHFLASLLGRLLIPIGHRRRAARSRSCSSARRLRLGNTRSLGGRGFGLVASAHALFIRGARIGGRFFLSMLFIQFGSLRRNLGKRAFGSAGQRGHGFLALLRGIGDDGTVFQLYQVVGNARRLTLFGNERDIFAGSDGCIGRNFTIAKATGNLKHDGNAGSVIVRGFREGAEFLEQSEHEQDSARNKAYAREHGERQRSSAFGKHDATQKHEHRRDNHAAKRAIAQRTQRANEDAGCFAAHLAAVVVSNHDNLATTRTRSIARLGGLVFRDDVLAHALRERLRKNRVVERFGNGDTRSNQGQHGSRNGDNGQNNAEQHRDDCHAIANDRRHKRVGVAGEVFDLRR